VGSTFKLTPCALRNCSQTNLFIHPHTHEANSEVTTIA